MARKINLFDATRTFSEEVAMFMVKSVWQSEYKLELAKAIESETASIKGLENMRGSAVMTRDQIDDAIKERESLIETYKSTYADVVSTWVRMDYSAHAKSLYKAYSSAEDEKALRDAFVEFLGKYELQAGSDCDLVNTLVLAVAGDSSRSNTRQFVKTGKASVETRGRAEFLKIVYRRLFDAMVKAGTIKVDGCKVKAGSETAELVVEIPELTRARYIKTKKSAK